MGADVKNHSDNWLENQDDFNDILKDLCANHNQDKEDKVDGEKEDLLSLEKKSSASKGRVQ